MCSRDRVIARMGASSSWEARSAIAQILRRASAIVDTTRQTVTIVEVLAREAECVIENRVGEVRQLFHGLDESLRTANVVEISAQQLAATKAREQILWIQR